MLVFIRVTAIRDVTATHSIAQKDHFALGVEYPWWLYAW